MAKILSNFQDSAGNTYPSSYWNCKFYPINLRTGQESIMFWFDGFKDKGARNSGKNFVGSIAVKLPQEKIAAYLLDHLKNKTTLPELAYKALAEIGSLTNEDGTPVNATLFALNAAANDTDPQAVV